MNAEPSNAVIPFIVDQHAEEVAYFWPIRDKAVVQPHYSLADIRDLDQQIEAHIDGLRVAGDVSWDVCEAALDANEPGQVFAAAVLALEGRDGVRLAKTLDVAAKSEATFRGFVSALGWVEKAVANRWLASMVTAPDKLYKRAGLAGLAIRRQPIDAVVFENALSGQDIFLKARALRAIGEHKRRDLQTALQTNLDVDNEYCRFWAAWSGTLLGDPSAAEQLKPFVSASDDFAHRAIELAPRFLDLSNAQEWLHNLAQSPDTLRFALIGAGATGDPLYLQTLINQMDILQHARIAGDAFSVITGLDLCASNLDLKEPPERVQPNPTENPDKDRAELDLDECLPWPDPELIESWWGQHKNSFQRGVRYLRGQPISNESCWQTLAEGTQRKRIAASLELARLNSDEPLFEWRAPGFLQRQWLGLGR